MSFCNTLKNITLSICAFSLLIACDTSNNNNNTNDSEEDNGGSPVVTIHELDDPDGMNPLATSAANAEYIQNNIFCKLLKYDQSTLKLVPQLAAKRPEITALEEGPYAGGMSLTYEIHPEAMWDNGTPVTGEDVVFSYKAVKNPKTNSAQLRPYIQFIHSVKVDPKNNKKFTIYSKERYFKAEESSGQEVFILPEYHYDPEGIMRQFTIEQLSTPENITELMSDPNITRFAENFNSPGFNRDPEKVVGCGPYKLVEWETGQRIVLERKEDWWGDKVEGNKMLEAHPPKLVYRVIRDWNAAITNAKDGQIDVLRTIPPNKYTTLKDDNKFSANFDLTTPDQFAYHYIGFNSKLPQFSDKRVRRAFAHLVDRDDMIEAIFEGMAIKTNGPINPRKPYYNKNIEDLDYNIEAAQRLLKEAGWEDSDGDNILDKMVGGKKVEMKISYKYNQGHMVRKSVGQILKDEAKRVGIEITLTPVDFPTLLEDADARNFDMLALAWINTPGLDDLKQIWHSEADKEGGDNRVGFGTAESDRLIDEIRITLDPDKRDDLYRQVQQIIFDEQPYIFLFVPSESIAIHNRFEGTETSPMRPGYTEALFKLRK